MQVWHKAFADLHANLLDKLACSASVRISSMGNKSSREFGEELVRVRSCPEDGGTQRTKASGDGLQGDGRRSDSSPEPRRGSCAKAPRVRGPEAPGEPGAQRGREEESEECAKQAQQHWERAGGGPSGSEVGPSTWSLLPKSSARSGVRQRILRHRRYPFAGALLPIAHGQAEDRLSLDAPLVAAALRDDPAFNLHVPTWGVGSFQAGRPPPTLGPAPVLVSVSKRGFSQLAARPPKARNPRLAVYARSSRS